MQAVVERRRPGLSLDEDMRLQCSVLSAVGEAHSGLSTQHLPCLAKANVEDV